MTLQVRPLTDDDTDQSWALGTLTFGIAPSTTRPPSVAGRTRLGAFDARGRLVARAWTTPYEQWWGGRAVPMAGVGGVAVHPDARGTGVGRRLLLDLARAAAEQGRPMSVLFPTSVGFYRPLGWETVAAIDTVELPTAALRGARAPEALGEEPAPVLLRTAGHDDASAVGGVYDRWAQQGNGALRRSGAAFARGAADLLAHDVVTLAERGTEAVGHVVYDRGLGYGAESTIRVVELVSLQAGATVALVRALGSWDSVAPQVRVRGAGEDLALVLGAAVPAPCLREPWMLRLTDAPAAVAARGWPVGVDVTERFRLHDPHLTGNARAWSLQVSSGAAVLESDDTRPDVPVLHVRGLALLWAGAASTAGLRRAGLLDGWLPGLDAAFAGPRPVLLDDF